MAVQSKIIPRYSNDKFELRVLDTEFVNHEAGFAMDLMRQFGIIAGEIDGEDSSGRQKGRQWSTEEVVERACSISAAAFEQFRKRGWVATLPDLDQIVGASSTNEEN